MPKEIKEHISSFIAGFLFALGLALSGMTNPLKVIGFLDVTGAWDADLLFVMAGAVGVYSIGYAAIRKLGKPTKPLFGARFHLPEQKKVTRDLIIGAALFGVGWGLAGFCPGPSLVAFFSGHTSPMIFTVSMLIGMGLFTLWNKRRAQ